MSSPNPRAANNKVRSDIQLADITREAYIYLGAGAAVLRQMANPGVGMGVAEHSVTLQQPLDRLRSTMIYIYVVTLGSDAERDAIAQRVSRAHVMVRSASYNAFDPHLQRWVAATLYKGAIELYELFHGTLDADNHDALYQHAAIYGTTLQMDVNLWPENRAAFEQYWEASLASYEVPEKVRDYVHQLLRGGAAPWYIKMMMPMQRFVTRALLDPALREKYQLDWTEADERRWQWFIRWFPGFYRALPKGIRHLPAKLYLRAWRKQRSR